MKKPALPILQVNDLEAVYDESILALRGVNLQMAEGSIVALLGANGAGKTTTLKAISNLISMDGGGISRGSVVYRGQDATRLDPDLLVERGMVQVLEGRRCFANLTVEENLASGAYVRHPSRSRLAESLDRVYTWFPRLRMLRHRLAGLTSGGEQQMIAIGRALMTVPRLVLLDEPSMGLAPILIEEIFGMIQRFNTEEGVSFLLAEQNTAQALAVADYVYLMENGRVATEGEGAVMAARDDVRDFYLGVGIVDDNTL